MSLRVYLLYSKRFKTRSSKFWKCLDSFYSLLRHIYNLRRLLPIKQTNQTKTIKFQIRQTLLRRSIYLCLYDLIKKLSHHHKRATNYNCKSGSSLEGSSFFVLDLLFWTAFSGWLYEHLSELYAHLVTQKTKSSLKSKTGWLPGLHSFIVLVNLNCCLRIPWWTIFLSAQIIFLQVHVEIVKKVEEFTWNFHDAG